MKGKMAEMEIDFDEIEGVGIDVPGPILEDRIVNHCVNLGWGVSKAGDILINAVRRHFREAAFHASEDARFALATLGNDAGMYGSVKMVMDH